MAVSSRQCAAEVLEIVPLVMRTIRGQVRRIRGGDLSMAQFRTLWFVHCHPEASLGEVAAHAGLTAPSTSKLVDGLVLRRLLRRDVGRRDRRRVSLSITLRGEALLQKAKETAQAHLGGLFSDLSDGQRGDIVRAMGIMRRAMRYDTDHRGEAGGPPGQEGRDGALPPQGPISAQNGRRKALTAEH